MDLAQTSGFIGLLSSIQERIEVDNMIRLKREEEEHERLSKTIIEEKKKATAASNGLSVANGTVQSVSTKKPRSKVESPEKETPVTNGKVSANSKAGKSPDAALTAESSAEKEKRLGGNSGGGAAALREKKKKKKSEIGDNETASVITMKSAKSTKTQQTATTSQTNKTVRTRLRSLLYYEEGAEGQGVAGERNGLGGGAKKATKKKAKEEAPPPPPPPPPKQSIFCGTGIGNAQAGIDDGLDFSKPSPSRKGIRPPSPPPSQIALFCGAPTTTRPEPPLKGKQPSNTSYKRPQDNGKSKGRCVIS